MAANWYYEVGGREIGPVSTEELQRLVATGRLAPTHNVRRSDMRQRLAAGQVKGLFQTSTRSDDTPQQWYYSNAGEQCGPVGASELKHLSLTGKLAPDTLVCLKSQAAWVRADTVKGLFERPVPNAVPPPLPLRNASSTNNDAAGAPASQWSSSELIGSPYLSGASQGSGYHRQRLVIALMAALGMVATFLPWVHAPIVGSIAGTAGDGWITLALFVPAMCMALTGNKLHPLLGTQRLIAAVPAAIAAIIGAWKFLDFESRKATLSDDNPFARALSVSVQVGVGIYLLVFSGIALAVAAWFLEGTRKQASK